MSRPKRRLTGNRYEYEMFKHLTNRFDWERIVLQTGPNTNIGLYEVEQTVDAMKRGIAMIYQGVIQYHDKD